MEKLLADRLKQGLAELRQSLTMGLTGERSQELGHILDAIHEDVVVGDEARLRRVADHLASFLPRVRGGVLAGQLPDGRGPEAGNAVNLHSGPLPNHLTRISQIERLLFPAAEAAAPAQPKSGEGAATGATS